MSDTMCFVGESAAACHHWLAVSVDEPKYHADNAETLADWLRRGYNVKRMTVREFNAAGSLNWCEVCCPKKRKDIAAKVELLMESAPASGATAVQDIGGSR